jgi:hypothetical protein
VPLNIWFVPSNSSHVGKFRVLMDALKERGDDVRLLDVDAAHPGALAARPQIQATGYPAESLPAGGYDPNAHWTHQMMQRGQVERAFATVLERIRADAILFGFDSFVSGRAFVRVARARGIPTLLIPDGLVVPPNPRFRQATWEGARDGFVEITQRWFRAGGPRGLSGVDGILVINAMGREVMIGQGVPADAIHVVGSPEYDDLAARLRTADAIADPEEVRRRLGLAGHGPVILFAHQTLDGSERSLVRTMVAAARRCGAVVLTKFHPRGGEKPEEWRSWAAQEGMGPGEAVFAASECTSIEALSVASACVTAYSTVSLEAFVCARPLVLIHYANVPYALPYGTRYGAALDAHSPRELEDALVAAVTDETVRRRLEAGRIKAIEGELGGLDGKSIERMMAAIDGTVARVSAGRDDA